MRYLKYTLIRTSAPVALASSATSGQVERRFTSRTGISYLRSIAASDHCGMIQESRRSRLIGPGAEARQNAATLLPAPIHARMTAAGTGPTDPTKSARCATHLSFRQCTDHKLQAIGNGRSTLRARNKWSSLESVSALACEKADDVRVTAAEPTFESNGENI
jgi:hypothetical protein